MELSRLIIILGLVCYKERKEDVKEFIPSSTRNFLSHTTLEASLDKIIYFD